MAVVRQADQARDVSLLLVHDRVAGADPTVFAQWIATG
jgi:hypothetical protein